MTDIARELRPVQVLLDLRRFIETPERHAGGGTTDFFDGDDAGFARHKTRLRGKITTIAQSLRKERRPVGFLKVQLRENALAKSYRPIGSLFTESHGFALVGANRIGEMVFQGTPDDLDRLDRIVDLRAEATPPFVLNKKTGLMERRASGYRSELGAIGDIDLHDRTDRMTFSAEQAVEWLSQPNTLGGYIVELFRPDPARNEHAIALAIAQLRDALAGVGMGLSVRPFLPAENTAGYGDPPLAMTVQLTKNPAALVALPFNSDGQPARSAVPMSTDADDEPDFSVDRHRLLLSILSEQSLVRSVELPPLVEASPLSEPTAGISVTVPRPKPEVEYPVVGIIDGGIAAIPELNDWRIGEAALVPAADRDESHGTFIAGLVVAGRTLNPEIAPAFEPGGCKFYDLDIFPRKDLRPNYFRDIEYFFDLLDEKIKAAKRDHGVRVFNLSFGLRSALPRIGYSPIADRFDRLARANDVILVICAGNLPPTGKRPSWPAKPADAVQMLAAFGAREGRITPPAEHLLGLTVGAINPPGISGHVPDVPTTYMRRGPGVGGARKPELSHYGGVAATGAGANRTGLASFNAAGEVVENCGTSFAAPPVAATMATLNHRLQGTPTRELLMALPIHRAMRPKVLTHKNLKHISREFVGFGIAPPADDVLMDDPYAITLVFSEVLKARQILQFPLTWPRSLVNADGSCRGRVDLTLVYTPSIDAAHKEEAQRLQLEAYLRQETGIDEETGESVYESQLLHDGAQVPQGMDKTEKYMLMAGLKWSPVKRYYANMPQGRGDSSNWELSLKSQTRAGARFPGEGVPFTILLTISDTSRSSPIHDEIRNQLMSTGLQIDDIMVAHRVRPRG